MRRPVMYLAGLLLATGASLALAGPASAAPSHHCHHNGGWNQDNENYKLWLYQQEIRSNSLSQNNGNSYDGFGVLNGLSLGGLFG